MSITDKEIADLVQLNAEANAAFIRSDMTNPIFQVRKNSAKSSGLGSIEQPPDIGHRPEQLHRLVLKRQEAFPLIEAAGAVVLRIDDHCEGGDLTLGGAVEGVGQQKPPATLPRLAPIYAQPG